MTRTRSIRLTDAQAELLAKAATDVGQSLGAYIVGAALAYAAGYLTKGPVTQAEWDVLSRRVKESLSG